MSDKIKPLSRMQVSQMKWEALESGKRKRWTHEAILALVLTIEVQNIEVQKLKDRIKRLEE